jgi:hypothetical protein
MPAKNVRQAYLGYHPCVMDGMILHSAASLVHASQLSGPRWVTLVNAYIEQQKTGMWCSPVVQVEMTERSQC